MWAEGPAANTDFIVHERNHHCCSILLAKLSAEQSPIVRGLRQPTARLELNELPHPKAVDLLQLKSARLF